MEPLRYRSAFIAKLRLASPAKLFTFLLPESVPCFQYHQRQDVRQVFHIIFVAQNQMDVRLKRHVRSRRCSPNAANHRLLFQVCRRDEWDRHRRAFQLR
jgi:hypothetical protein